MRIFIYKILIKINTKKNILLVLTYDLYKN